MGPSGYRVTLGAQSAGQLPADIMSIAYLHPNGNTKARGSPKRLGCENDGKRPQIGHITDYGRPLVDRLTEPSF
jgi:hypothetical protein